MPNHIRLYDYWNKFLSAVNFYCCSEHFWNYHHIPAMSLYIFLVLPDFPYEYFFLLRRGFTEQEKILIRKIRENQKNIETHCRDMVVIPEMFGTTVKVYSGKEFIPVIIEPDMIGHYLGEFVLTRRRVQHSAPGIGATRSSASLSVK